MSKMANRARMTVANTGAGNITLGAAVSGYQTFAGAGIVNGDTISYAIEDGTNWEVGTGVYSSTGPTLSRNTVVASSASGTTISITTAAQVFVTALASDLQSGMSATNLVERDSTGAIRLNDGTAAAPSLSRNNDDCGIFFPAADQVGISTNGTQRAVVSSSGLTLSSPLTVASGGTGLTSLTAGHIPFGNGTGAFGSSANLFWDDTNSRLVRGNSAAIAALGITPALQSHGTTTSACSGSLNGWGSASPLWQFNRSAGSIGVYTSVASGNILGALNFSGADGTDFIQGALIRVEVDSAPSSSSMPARIAFLTTTSGSSTATERMRIDSSGNVGIGTTASNARLTLQASNLATAAGSVSNLAQLFAPNGNTDAFEVLYSRPSTGSTWTSADLILRRSVDSTAGQHSIRFKGSNYSTAIYYGSSELVTVLSDGSVGIGNNNPDFKLKVVNSTNSNLAHFYQGGASLNTDIYINNVGSANNFLISRRSNGESWFYNSGADPFVFHTNAQERLRIDSSGNVGIGTSSPSERLSVSGAITATTSIRSSGATSGIGYATGAGGTVTQATSRTTGVTINNVCGQITLVSAAGSTSWQSFTVTNSAVASTDTIIVNQNAGTDLYQIFVTNVTAGSFQITFATTGGTTTEQPVFGFSVIKAVAA